MIAALDGSPLILMGKAAALPVLARVFHSVIVAPAVRRESVLEAPTPIEANALAAELDRLEIREKKPNAEAVKKILGRYGILGRGEIGTLALVASKAAATAVIDDRIARQAARIEGIPAVGTLGVLVRAHRRGLMNRAEVGRVVERLTAGGLWLSPDVMEAFWSALGGR